jgi:glycosyltransferase involved in cell wall biosynthesis
MSLTEKGRNWPYEKGEDLGFPYVLHRGIHPYLSNTPFHINPGILTKAAFCKQDVAIVAGGWPYPSTFLVLLLKRKGVRLFWSESNMDSTRYRHRFISFARRFILSQSDGFCIPNDRARDWINSCLKETVQKPFLCLPNLVDEALYRKTVPERRKFKKEIRAGYNIPIKDVVFLCPVRLLRRKGVNVFLTANQNVDVKNTTVVIAGDGPEKENLIRLAKDMNTVKVLFPGFCNQDQMIDLYAAADVFLLPSFEDPNPLAVIEACHSGLPLLVSRLIGNHPETVKEGINGWLFDPNSHPSIRKNFETVCHHTSCKLEKMGQVSYAIGNENFNTEKVVRAFVDSLNQAVKRKKSQSKAV